MRVQTLGERRELFTLELARLLIRIATAGFTPRLDEVKRSKVTALVYGMSPSECGRAAQLLEPEFALLAKAIRECAQVKGSAVSVHVDGVAADIVLFRGGQLQGAEAFEPFGRYWKRIGPLFCWGGDWGDAGHFSVTPDRVRK